MSQSSRFNGLLAVKLERLSEQALLSSGAESVTGHRAGYHLSSSGWGVNGQRVAVITQLVRADPDDPTEASLQTAVVRQVAETLAEDEMPVFDAGFKIREVQMAQLPRHVVRLAKNFTVRRNVLPLYKGHGRRPEYGELVRPLS